MSQVQKKRRRKAAEKVAKRVRAFKAFLQEHPDVAGRLGALRACPLHPLHGTDVCQGSEQCG